MKTDEILIERRGVEAIAKCDRFPFFIRKGLKKIIAAIRWVNSDRYIGVCINDLIVDQSTLYELALLPCRVDLSMLERFRRNTVYHSLHL